MADLDILFKEYLASLPEARRAHLLPGASPEELASQEARLQAIRPEARLPDPLKILYSFCGGQEPASYQEFLFDTYTLISLPQAVSAYLELRSVYETAFKPHEKPGHTPWFRSQLFPFCHQPGESGCLLCMDYETEEIYLFDSDDGALALPEFKNMDSFLKKSG